ncbi:uncharacterized protein DNG_00884 [Cephalotrichum gorgonifer]|uniref:Flavin-containing monooxygenase 1 n=1 Tax=Cephalotrichum gorgonifer TaxID=2041049 RepID=A0AAE8MQ62_9PEZI|nr:uncharacterized protein DNG_00884 [Cephalotrichum gorgonifer]
MISDAKRVAVVGAGISGLVSIKECVAAGFSVQCFEKSNTIGGQWAYNPDPDSGDVHSSIYQGCILNSCRDSSSFADFPMDPAVYPDYFGHKLHLRYLNEYADHFKLKDHIQLRTEVLQCEPGPNGGWDLTIRKEGGKSEVQHFDALMAATGILSKPRTPEFAGREAYMGEFLHSHFYRTPGRFEGKKVAIIGLGSSAVDIACEVGPQAKELHLITRRGGWVLPRYILGKPTEAWDDRATQMWVPHKISQYIQTKLINLIHAQQPEELKCDHKLLEQNPTTRGDFIEKVNTGIVKLHRASIDTFTPSGLSLSTGTEIDADVVICCTGYHMTDMPFLPRDAVVSREMPAPHIDLYKHFVSPWYDDLFIIGRVENFGPLAPTAEAQARVAAAMLSGRLQKPGREEMLASIRKTREESAKAFIKSDRHLQTVHSIQYIDDILGPLGAAPTMFKLLGRATSVGLIRALKVFAAVYFGVPSSGQWRLLGEGRSEKLAEAMVLRISAGKKELSKEEREALEGKF